MYCRQAGIIELTHRLLINGADVVQGPHRFVDGGESFTSIFLSHGSLSPQIDRFQSLHASP
jgi:hypothetical protein